MPHLVLQGEADLEAFTVQLAPEVHRWRHAVLKLAQGWRRRDGRAVLVEAVAVERSRPLHPVLVISLQDQTTRIRLWPPVEVERTPAVQRLLALVASILQQRHGAGPVTRTNLVPEALEGIVLVSAPESEAEPEAMNGEEQGG